MKKVTLAASLLIISSLAACSPSKGTFEDVQACVKEARGDSFMLKDMSELEKCANDHGWKLEEYMAEGFAQALEENK